MKQRLKLAIGLLRNTTLSIGEITLECGFENQTHFSRRFKESKNQNFLAYLHYLNQNNYPSFQEVVQNNYLFNLSVPAYAHLADRHSSPPC